MKVKKRAMALFAAASLLGPEALLAKDCQGAAARSDSFVKLISDGGAEKATIWAPEKLDHAMYPVLMLHFPNWPGETLDITTADEVTVFVDRDEISTLEAIRITMSNGDALYISRAGGVEGPPTTTGSGESVAFSTRLPTLFRDLAAHPSDVGVELVGPDAAVIRRAHFSLATTNKAMRSLLSEAMSKMMCR